METKFNTDAVTSSESSASFLLGVRVGLETSRRGLTEMLALVEGIFAVASDAEEKIKSGAEPAVEFTAATRKINDLTERIKHGNPQTPPTDQAQAERPA